MELIVGATVGGAVPVKLDVETATPVLVAIVTAPVGNCVVGTVAVSCVPLTQVTVPALTPID
jgi:uncharacterized membrane protein YeaQ/YmgE (transglycosylase-associated protein family)